MLNIFAKILLVSTSLSPVLLVMAVNQAERHTPWTCWAWWLGPAIFLMILCWILLRNAEKKSQQHLIHIKEFERKDQEMLTYLFIYLLPFIRSENLAFAREWITSLFVVLIIIIAIVHVRAFHFNPIMRLFGYRFYAIKNLHGVSNLLISKEDLRRPDKEVQTVRLAHDVYLHTEGVDAQ